MAVNPPRSSTMPPSDAVPGAAVAAAAYGQLEPVVAGQADNLGDPGGVKRADDRRRVAGRTRRRRSSGRGRSRRRRGR